MKQNRISQTIIYGFLFLVIFLYRLAFKDDFLLKGLILIAVYCVLDLFTIIAVAKISERIWFIRTEQKRKPFKKPVSLLASILVFFLFVKTLKILHYYAYFYITGLSARFEAIFSLESYQIFDSYIVVAFGTVVLIAFRFYEKWNSEKIYRDNLEKEKINAELRFLKAQINPHFIFNTLNNIHFLVDKSNEKARAIIHDFSELLRYQLYETSNDKVSIFDEINYIEKYLSLQKIRKEDGFKASISYVDLIDFKIAPLLLIVPIENAFKYAGTADKDYINILLQMNPGNLFTFNVVNSKAEKYYSKSTMQSGLGLSNLRNRVTLLYGSAANVLIKETEHSFEFTLTLALNNHEDY